MFSILRGKDNSQLNLILDEIGKHLFIPICRILSERQENLIFFCYRYPPEYYAELIPSFNERFAVYNGFDDPLGWVTQEINTSASALTIKQKINSLKKDPSKRSIVLIDDGRMFLRSTNFMNVKGEFKWAARMLYEVSIDFQTWFFMNPDLFSEDQMASLHYTASMHATFTMATEQPFIKYKYECLTKHKMKKDKIELSAVEIQSNGTIKQSRISKLNVSKQIIDDAKDEADPTADLTFNLRLTESEKEARSKVQLPYLLSDAQKEKYLNQSRRHVSIADGNSGDTVSVPGGGNIIYEPDDADDFDEEDPDDDLDI